MKGIVGGRLASMKVYNYIESSTLTVSHLLN